MPKLIFRGIYQQVDPRYGRLETKEGRSFFVGSRGRNGAFEGDTVEAFIQARSTEEGRSDEAKITRIIQRSGKYVFGVFREAKGKPFGFVELKTPENERVYIPKTGMNDAKDGDMVAIRISGFGPKTHGEIMERIGNSEDIHTERELLVRESGVPRIFWEKVLSETKTLSVWVDSALKRKDLSDRTILTIDGVDARDLDDAISVERYADGTFELGVHIADVAEYVREGSAIDREAFRRGTSIYLSDRVIPMLPEKLSNDLCSLHPGEKKLCVSLFLTIGKHGEVTWKRIEETALFSKRRCTYEEVQSWHDRDQLFEKPSEEILTLIEHAYSLARIIDERRKIEGRIDLEIPELSVRLDEAGEPTEIRERERKASHRMIETFMVLANEEISKSLSQIAPFIYRVHEAPSIENQNDLRELFIRYGVRLPSGDIRPKELQEGYSRIKTLANLPPIERLVLSKLSKAKYSDQALGHYGLALSYYSHFTSPIRRYPDLLAHRIIKESLRAKNPEKNDEWSLRKVRYKALLPEATKRCSENERRAEALERAVESFDGARYMERHIGEIFHAIVVGKSKFAYYVKLENGIEGAVYIWAKRRPREQDFPEFGKQLRVRLVAVDRSYGRIDFEVE